MSNDRKRILDMVENGTITAAEAIKLLEAMGPDKEAADSSSASSGTSSSSSSYGKAEQTRSSSQSDDWGNESSSRNSRSDKKEFPFNLEEIFGSFTGGSSSKEESKRKSSSSQTGDKLKGLFQSTLNKVKDMDLEFNMGPSLEFSHTFELAADNLLDVEVQIDNGQLEIRPWDQDFAKAECDIKVFGSDDKEKAKQKFVESVTFKQQYRKLQFLSTAKSIKIDTILYVPRATYDRWDIRLYNGTFTSSGANVNTVNAKAANGQVTLSNFLVERAKLETANGNLSISNTRADQIQVETLNGKITVEGAIDELEAKSVNGNITYTTSSTSARKVEVKSVAGSIDLSLPEELALDGELKSNFGRFNFNAREMDELDERDEFMQRKLRFTRERDGKSKTFVLADAKTGTISLRSTGGSSGGL